MRNATLTNRKQYKLIYHFHMIPSPRLQSTTEILITCYTSLIHYVQIEDETETSYLILGSIVFSPMILYPRIFFLCFDLGPLRQH